jgi:hypothetical protein
MAHTKLLFRSVVLNKHPFIDNKLMGKWFGVLDLAPTIFYNTEILFRRNRYSIHVLISRRRRPATPTTNNTVLLPDGRDVLLYTLNENAPPVL